MATSQLDTIPASKDVTTSMVGTWSVEFAASIPAGATISTASAALFDVRANAAVAGFVTNASISLTAINVTWTASVLTKGKTYRLETLATLNTGAKVELLTTVRCVA